MTRPHPALVELAANRSIPPVADWNELLRSASEHRMLGLLWSRMVDGEFSRQSDDMQLLAMLGLRIRALQEQNWQALREVVDTLRGIGVEVATIKGVTAEARWYDRLGERPSSDVDVLIDPAAIGREREIVAAFEPSHPLLPYVADLANRGLLETVQVRVSNHVVVDIHFALLEIGLPLLQRNVVWARTQLIDHPDGGSIRVLDSETALVHLLLHLNKDRFSRLLWYADIVRLLEKETDLDWEYFDRFVRAEGLDAPVYSSLDAVLADLDLPPLDRVPSGWKAFVWRHLWSPATRLLGDEGAEKRQHRQRVLSLFFKGRKREAFRWWLSKLFPPDPILALRYPRTRGPYPVRVVVTRFIGAAAAVKSAIQRLAR